MRAVEIDFQDPWSARRRRWLLLLALAIGVLCAMCLDYRGVKQQELELMRSTGGQSSEVVPARARILTQAQAAEVRAANQVIEALNVPWGQLVEAFESRDPGQVALLAIEPDARKRVVRITGEVRTLALLPDYLELLGRKPLLREVILLEHQVQLQDPQKPVRFVVQAAWGRRELRGQSDDF